MTPLEYIEKGGVINRILAGLLLVVLALAIERLLYFFFSREFKRNSQTERIRIRSERTVSMPAELRKEELLELGAELKNEMERGLWLFSFITAAAPSMGLLGTVLGLIASFQGMASAGPEMSIQDFSGGIWVAMLTTALGLIVALPALFCSHLFGRIVELRLLKMSLAVSITENTNGEIVDYA